ncbi:MAG: radical SAM protein [Nitrospiraceae bacterium]|nr:radical SAM protein [Nitrospiraceae bacterium]
MVHETRLRHIPERFPLACQWEVTCRCNLHCVMCYTDCFNVPEQIRRELPLSDLLRILDQLAEAGTLELCITGGEPLMRPDFFEFYERAVALGFLVTLFTNGTLITETVADRFAASPPARVEISLHGMTSATFDAITQASGSYDRCRHAIELLRARHIPLVLKTTALTINRDELLHIKRHAATLEGVSFKLGEEIRPALNGDGDAFRHALGQRELAELHAQDNDLSADAGRERAAATAPCRSGLQRFHIDAYGTLQLCSGNRREGYDLRTGSFHDGFYRALPTFGCPWKPSSPIEFLQPAGVHG